MVSKELEVGFNPPEKDIKADERANLILDVIQQKGCSYPSEICGELDISKETVYRKLRFLEKNKKIKRMTTVTVDKVPDWLQPRLSELWAHGIKGNAIKRMTWYAVIDNETKK